MKIFLAGMAAGTLTGCTLMFAVQMILSEEKQQRLLGVVMFMGVMLAFNLSMLFVKQEPARPPQDNPPNGGGQ